MKRLAAAVLSAFLLAAFLSAGAIGGETDTGGVTDTDTGGVTDTDTDTGGATDTNTGGATDTNTGGDIDTNMSVVTDTNIGSETDAGGVTDTDTGGVIDIGGERELCALSERVAGGDSLAGVSVRLTADIALTQPFSPIGVSAEAPFSGAFFGGGHRISGLSVEGGDFAGLFGCVVCGQIDGVRLEGARVCGNNYVSLLVGRLFAYKGAAALTNCSASGRAEGVCYVGGVVGYAGAAAYGTRAAVSVSGCGFAGDVVGDIYAGGIAGKAEARSGASAATATVEGCVSRGSIAVRGRYGSLAGGVCGGLEAESEGGRAVASVSGCVSYASATAEIAAAGGVCGAAGGSGRGASASVGNCVAFGNTCAAALSGGLAGKCETKDGAFAAIENCIAAGNVTGGSAFVFAAGEGVANCESPFFAPVRYPDDAKPPAYLRGDADGDGFSTCEDAALLLQYDAGLVVLGEAALQSCDVTGDGEVDNLDAAVVLRGAAVLRDAATG